MVYSLALLVHGIFTLFTSTIYFLGWCFLFSLHCGWMENNMKPSLSSSFAFIGFVFIRTSYIRLNCTQRSLLVLSTVSRKGLIWHIQVSGHHVNSVYKTTWHQKLKISLFRHINEPMFASTSISLEATLHCGA